MAIGKYAEVAKEAKQEKKETVVAKYSNDTYNKVNSEEFAREWEEACNLYKEGIAAWSKKWCREWNEACRKLKASPKKQ